MGNFGTEFDDSGRRYIWNQNRSMCTVTGSSDSTGNGPFFIKGETSVILSFQVKSCGEKEGRWTRSPSSRVGVGTKEEVPHPWSYR